MKSPSRNKVVSALEEMNFKIEKVELRKNYWYIGYKKMGIDGLVYFMVEDTGLSLPQIVWQFCGYRVEEGS